MIHRCPHCDLILLEAEWLSGVCVECTRPLTESTPVEPAPESPPAPTKRRSRWPWLGGIAIALLAFAGAVLWYVSRPDVTDRLEEPDPLAEVQDTPRPDHPESAKNEEPKPRPEEPKKDLAKAKPDDKKKEAGPPAKESPPPLAKEDAAAFAQEILMVTSVLAEKYYRELDEDRLTVWAIRGLYEAAKEPVPPSIQKRMRKESEKEGLDRLNLLVDAREFLGQRPELVAPKDVDSALRHLFRRLDPHTTLLADADMTRLNLLQNGNKSGELGLVVRHRPGSDDVEVVTPIKDGPAYAAGIRGGDIILRVRLLDDQEGKPLDQPEEVAPNTLAREDARCSSVGRIGSRVEITARHSEADRPQMHTLSYARVQKEKVVGVRRRADDTWDHLLDAKAGIYYVRLIDFHGPDSARVLDRLLAGFDKPKIQGLVLDLRFTGAGLIQTAFEVAELFVKSGVIVEFRSRRFQNGKGHWTSRGKGRHASLPLVCLVNEQAGTCTEIVASALQDHKRARTVGERTNGKASAQNYFRVDRGTLRITTSHAYRPNGKPLDRSMTSPDPFEPSEFARLFAAPDQVAEWGVTPDEGYVVPLPTGTRDALREQFQQRFHLLRPPQGSKELKVRDPQLEKGLSSLKGKKQ